MSGSFGTDETVRMGALWVVLVVHYYRLAQQLLPNQTYLLILSLVMCT